MEHEQIESGHIVRTAGDSEGTGASYKSNFPKVGQDNIFLVMC